MAKAIDDILNVVLLCRTRYAPAPEQVAEALCQASYQAFVEVKSGGAAEILYAPGRMPVIVISNLGTCCHLSRRFVVFVPPDVVVLSNASVSVRAVGSPLKINDFTAESC